jgi:hypothetical protein
MNKAPKLVEGVLVTDNDVLEDIRISLRLISLINEFIDHFLSGIGKRE